MNCCHELMLSSGVSVLLERVFLRIGSAETDEQLEATLAKFLTPVLLKLASQADGVRKKVSLTTDNIDFQATYHCFSKA